MVMMLGAQSDIFSRGALITEFIRRRMNSLALRACSRASAMISPVMPSILMSICSAVMPFAVPATLKSMSPR